MDDAVDLLMLCSRCHRIFPTGLGFRPGIITLMDCGTRCPYCGLQQNIPDGIFTVVLGKIVDLIGSAAEPLRFAGELLEEVRTIHVSPDPTAALAASPNAKKVFAKGVVVTGAVLTFAMTAIQTVCSLLQTTRSTSAAPVAPTVNQVIEAYNAGVAAHAPVPASPPRPISQISIGHAGSAPSPTPINKAPLPQRKKRQGSHTPPKARNQNERRGRRR